MNSYGSLLLCSHLRFHVINQLSTVLTYIVRFIQYLNFFFNKFHENNIFYLLHFCSLWASGMKLHFPCMSRIQNTKICFFNWLHFFFSWLFLYHKEVTRVFSSTLNFAWQFSYQWNRRRAIPQTQICKFGRTKFDTHTILSRDEVLISFQNYTSSSVAFFLMQCEKSTVMFSMRTCISFAEL